MKKKKKRKRTHRLGGDDSPPSPPPRRKNSQQGGQTGAGDFCFEDEGAWVCVGGGGVCVIYSSIRPISGEARGRPDMIVFTLL